MRRPTLATNLSSVQHFCASLGVLFIAKLHPTFDKLFPSVAAKLFALGANLRVFGRQVHAIGRAVSVQQLTQLHGFHKRRQIAQIDDAATGKVFSGAFERRRIERGVLLGLGRG